MEELEEYQRVKNLSEARPHLSVYQDSFDVVSADVTFGGRLTNPQLNEFRARFSDFCNDFQAEVLGPELKEQVKEAAKQAKRVLENLLEAVEVDSKGKGVV